MIHNKQEAIDIEEIPSVIPSVGDEASRDLATHLKQAATELTGMQHEAVVRNLAGNVFVSHTPQVIRSLQEFTTAEFQRANPCCG